MAGGSGRVASRAIQGKSGPGLPALDPTTLLAIRQRARPEDRAKVRERLHSDDARFWFDVVTAEAPWLAVVDLAAVAEWANAEGEREFWQRDVAEARAASRPILSQYLVEGEAAAGKKAAQALGNGALARRYSEECDRLRAALGFTPAAAARIREQRQRDMFAEAPEEPAEEQGNAGVSRIDALAEKLVVINGGLAP